MSESAAIARQRAARHVAQAKRRMLADRGEQAQGRALIARALVALIMFSAQSAHAVPYAFAGNCYATPADVLVAFQNQYPIIGETQYTSHVSSSITAAGVLSYSLSTRAITGNTLSSRTGTMQMVSCDKVDAPIDYTIAGALFTFFFSSVVMLWFAAKNMGLIVAAVRRF